jgi:S-formylglutathione hydrolase FrmB
MRSCHPWWMALPVCLATSLSPASGFAAAPTEARPLEFLITFDRTITPEPFTGRLYVLLTSSRDREPRLGINWFKPEPFFAVDVKGWRPGAPARVAADALGYPLALNRVPKGTYTVQAVLDLNRGGRHFGTSPGNGYSKPVRLTLDPASSGPVRLHIDQVASASVFKETDRVKLVDIESKRLTAFHGRPVRMRAGVVVPQSWTDAPDRRYGVVYEIPGFGGNHRFAFRRQSLDGAYVVEAGLIHVVLNPDCPFGHHVFADSANNGPWGQALVEELIPHIEKRFHALGRPEGRFLTGHSSGGWSSLWLQVTYPDFFNGTWSTSPDPVDFRDFQRVNIYQPGVNVFTDEKGKPRPIARRGSQPVLFYKGFSDMEVVFGRGGQLGSFEAVFSPRGTDGKPRPLWDRKTGAVDPEVARSWQKYDIRLILERNWKTLGPKLRGKLHVWTGSEDTFYLDGATALLKESLSRLGSDAVVEVVPGRHHGNLSDRKLRERIAREMASRLKASLRTSR